ncbi:MAG: rod-binding protein [Bdellovibrionales bacterium]|nr:rod-binding protein [Bdellovibrionales bacterium]
MSVMKIQNTIPVHQSKADPDAKIREAAQMYEQHFLNEMTKSMRKTVEHSKLSEPSMAEKIYSEQLDGQYVESWAKSGGVGLANIIYDQLQERFFNRGGAAPHPQGPVPINKGTSIKIDNGHSPGLPIEVNQSTLPNNDVSFLYEWESSSDQKPREVSNPYDGKVLQTFKVEGDRSVVKLAHENGVTSTISFIGQTNGLRVGEELSAGQKLGLLASYAKGLTWQVGQVGT